MSIVLLYVLALTAVIAAEQFFPSQRFSSSGRITASGSGKMLPPPAPVSREYYILNDLIGSLSDMSIVS
jgi:hypothetical protein